MALLLNGSEVENGSIFLVFLKKSSDEALKGSASLKGSPPNGSAAETASVRVTAAAGPVTNTVWKQLKDEPVCGNAVTGSRQAVTSCQFPVFVMAE